MTCLLPRYIFFFAFQDIMYKEKDTPLYLEGMKTVMMLSWTIIANY